MIKIYGIKQCQTMKKTFDWLDAHALLYEFHDYKKFGLEPAKLQAWISQLGWQALLNTRGTTWRKLPEEVRAAIDEASAIKLMIEQPSLIKRPVIEAGSQTLVGFDEASLASLKKETQ